MTNTQRAAFRDASTVGDSVFAVLASERRRTVLRCLRTADAPVAMADLARDVLARERDADPGDIPEEVIERVYVSLHHCHLPKLADGGYLQYDEDQSSVALTDDANSLEPLLEWAANRTG